MAAERASKGRWTNGRKITGAAQWPDTFAALTAEQWDAVEQALVSGWHEGWNPTCEDVQDLADEARGIITVDEYLARALRRAERPGQPAGADPGGNAGKAIAPAGRDQRPDRKLRNKFDEHNAVVLDLLEKSATALRVRQLNSGQVQIPHTFDAAHVKAIHANLFQDVYDWAGEFRNVDISKKRQAFADHDGGGIESYLRYATRTIQEQNWKGMDHESFARVSATVFAYVNIAHPFREGNGRVTKSFLRDMAEQSEFRFDFDQISKEDWNEMARLTMPGPDENHPRPEAAYASFLKLARPRDTQNPVKSDDAEAKRLVDLVRLNVPNERFSAAMDDLISESDLTKTPAASRQTMPQSSLSEAPEPAQKAEPLGLQEYLQSLGIPDEAIAARMHVERQRGYRARSQAGPATQAQPQRSDGQLPQHKERGVGL